MTTNDEIIERIQVTDRVTDLHNSFLMAARALITRAVLCHGCGKPMLGEFVHDEFDGVLNDTGKPFHHGCEDF